MEKIGVETIMPADPHQVKASIEYGDGQHCCISEQVLAPGQSAMRGNLSGDNGVAGPVLEPHVTVSPSAARPGSLSALLNVNAAPLVANTAWNLIAMLVPAVCVIPAMGIMGRKMGVESFGLFTLVYAIFGYSGIFDVGLTRAVVRSVSVHRTDKPKLQQIVGTASTSVLVLGLLAAIGMYFAAQPLVHLLHVTQERAQDFILSLHWLSLGVPSLLLTLIWFSYFEGQEQFAQLSIIKSITSTMVVILPAAAIFTGVSLQSAVIGLVLARVIAAVVAHTLYRRAIGKVWLFERSAFVELWKFGSWITISNVVSPIMGNFDRFVLSNMLGAHSIAFYTAPSEAIARSSVIPGSVAKSLFPRLNNKKTDPEHQSRIAFQILCVCSLALGLPLCLFSREVMTIWMGPAFSGTPASVLRILVIGFALNSLALVPFAKIQARGDSHITAAVHLCEVVPYLALLVILVRQFSFVGAAAAWTLRMAADLFVLQWLAGNEPVGIAE